MYTAAARMFHWPVLSLKLAQDTAHTQVAVACYLPEEGPRAIGRTRSENNSQAQIDTCEHPAVNDQQQALVGTPLQEEVLIQAFKFAL